jgi:hypothetical protein
MIYGSTGATHFDQLAKILTGYEITGARSSGIFMGILFIALATLFKITALPLQAAVERIIVECEKDDVVYGLFFVFYFIFLIFADKFFPRTALSNPILVTGQLAAVLFFYLMNDAIFKKRLALLVFGLSILASLYLRGAAYPSLIFGSFITFSIFSHSKSDLAFFAINLLWLFDSHLARWGFFLNWFLLGFLIFTSVLKKQGPCTARLLGIVTVGSLLLMKAAVDFGSLYSLFEERPLLRLTALLYGAIQIYICLLRPKTVREVVITFLFIFLFGAIMAYDIFVHPGNNFQIFPPSWFIFLFSNSLASFTFLYLFQKWGSLREIHPLIPIYFSLLSTVLSHFPELAPISRWMEGFQLLFLFLSLFLFLEEKFANSKASTSLKKKENQGVTSVAKPPCTTGSSPSK